MLDLEYDLKYLCRRNRDGSRMTQAQREQRLRMIARKLNALGYRHLRANSLKPKHVRALVCDWQQQGLSVGTIKNRMADLRWWATKTGRRAVIASDNAHYGIEQRTYTHDGSNARSLPDSALELIGDEHVGMSLRLQAAFGLDAMKRSNSSPPTPTAATGSCSKPPGARAGGSARSPSAPPHNANSSTNATPSPAQAR